MPIAAEREDEDAECTGACEGLLVGMHVREAYGRVRWGLCVRSARGEGRASVDSMKVPRRDSRGAGRFRAGAPWM